MTSTKSNINICRVSVLVLFIFTTFLNGVPVNLETAAKVASAQARIVNSCHAETEGIFTEMTKSLGSGKPLYDESGRILAFVFEGDAGGFIVVTADTDLVPVVAFAEHGSFIWDEEPCNILLHPTSNSFFQHIPLSAHRILTTSAL